MPNFIQNSSNYILSNLDVNISSLNKYLYLDSSGNIVGKDVPTSDKVQNILNNNAKAFITGTTSSSSNTGSQIFDNGVYLCNTAGRLNSKQLSLGNENVLMEYDSTKQAIKISFL